MQESQLERLLRVEEPVEVLPAPPKKLRLDLGCGPHPKEGFVGVDKHPFEGVRHVVDLREDWPWGDGMVGEVWCSHTVEHLTSTERCHFFNELYRVLAPGAQATVITPHWCSCRAYGDPTHQWPPVSEFFYYYLDREWRLKEAPHTDASVLPWGYTCDFDVVQSYVTHAEYDVKAEEVRTFAVRHYKEAALDLYCVLTRKKEAVDD
jgi:hypothetical protein